VFVLQHPPECLQFGLCHIAIRSPSPEHEKGRTSLANRLAQTARMHAAATRPADEIWSRGQVLHGLFTKRPSFRPIARFRYPYGLSTDPGAETIRR
jgi:hypothetical protein